jgi:parafibromin
MTTLTDPAIILSTLQEWGQQETDGWSAATLSSDGTQLTLKSSNSDEAEAIAIDATVKVTVTNHENKSCTYSVAAIYLQVRDPEQRLLTYRNACKQYNVTDPIGAIDKTIILDVFGSGSAGATATSTETTPATTAAATEPSGTTPTTTTGPEVATQTAAASTTSTVEPSTTDTGTTATGHETSRSSNRHKKKDRKDKRKSSSSSRDRTSAAASSEKKKKVKTSVTNEELVGNLTSMVDKRTAMAAQDENIRRAAEITAALSADGWQLSSTALEDYRKVTADILANEIPVGDSASILRAANPRNDLSRVLEIFQETLHLHKLSSKHKSSTTTTTTTSGTGNTTTTPHKAHLMGQKPVIVVPKGMSSPITMMNAHEFFCNGRFIHPDILRKQKATGSSSGGGSTTTKPSPVARFTRKLGTSGALVEFEITDNPRRLLGADLKQWDRIVAVIALGQAWQFTDWFGPYKNPVQLFSQTFGFFVTLEGDKVPQDVKGWAVKHAKLNRDKRGLDSVTLAAFWNGLEEFMTVHKRELLPQTIIDD